MTNASEAAKPAASTPKAYPAPVIVDLGRQKSKSVKQLRKGEGKLVDDVNSAIEDLRTAGTISPSAQTVIVVVREKRSNKGLLAMLNPKF